MADPGRHYRDFEVAAGFEKKLGVHYPLMDGDGKEMLESYDANEAFRVQIDRVRTKIVVREDQFAPRRQQHRRDYYNMREAVHDSVLRVWLGFR